MSVSECTCGVDGWRRERMGIAFTGYFLKHSVAELRLIQEMYYFIYLSSAILLILDAERF